MTDRRYWKVRKKSNWREDKAVALAMARVYGITIERSNRTRIDSWMGKFEMNFVPRQSGESHWFAADNWQQVRQQLTEHGQPQTTVAS